MIGAFLKSVFGQLQSLLTVLVRKTEINIDVDIDGDGESEIAITVNEKEENIND